MSISANFPNVRPSLLLDFANSQQLDPRITFSRSTTAPYYDGKTSALAEQNLFLQSQAFVTSPWTTNNATNTNNATTAPDGTTTANSLIPNTTASVSHSIIQATGVAFTVYTMSCYAKANGYTNIQFYGDSSGNFTITFDLTAVTTAFGGSATSSSITSVGNGWYRCVGTFTMATSSRLNIQGFPTGASASNFGNTFTGDGTSGVYIWGAQLEQRSSVTAYNATTTTPITNYIPQLLTAPINAPRFDFNPTTGESLGLLIEQSSTNLLFQSQTFNNLGVWAVANATLTANANIAPDGTQTVFQLIPSASSAFTNVSQSITAIAQAYTTSWYVKYNGVQFVQILFGGSLSTNYANYDLINGTVTGGTYTSATITPVGNGVYRISTTNNFAATSSGIYLAAIVTGTSARASNYTGNGYSGIYIWGAQLEALPFATSYIPTTSAQVTRAADVDSGLSTSGWYNNGQGTFYMDFKSIYSGSTSPTTKLIGFNSTQNILYTNNGGNGVYCYDGTSASQQTGLTFGTRFQLTSSYGTAGKQMVLNGGSVNTATYNNLFANQSNVYIGNDNVSSGQANGWIRKMAYYPQQLTVAQTQALTGS